MKKKIVSLLLLCLMCIPAASAKAAGTEYALNEVEAKATPDGKYNLIYEKSTGKPLTGVVTAVDAQDRKIKETPYVNGMIHGTVRHYRGGRVTLEELYENGSISGLVYY